jgi:NAD(P)H-dependent flavin oxidoreductase YrpB (nitropropane dioxygenase family)
VCQATGVERPVVQAPLAAVPRLTAAVSNVGALGMVTLTWSDDVGAAVRQTALTTRPPGGNFYSSKITAVLLTSFLTRRYGRRERTVQRPS